MAKRSFARIGVNSKRRTIFIVAAIIVVVTLLAFTGLTLPIPGRVGLTRLNGAPDIRFGIDIRGGVEAVFTPRDFAGEVTPDQMDAASRVLNKRLDDLQILDREVIVGSGSDRITVRFPWRSDEVDFNPEQALQELGQMALLTFRSPDGQVLLTGADVQTARFGVDQMYNVPLVQLELNADGAVKFENATRTYLGQPIGIYMDEQMISDPVVEAVIPGGQAVIQGNFTAETAHDLAQTINAGALPFALEATSSSTISPMLGQDSLRVMVMAGAVAFILICLFMLLYYRLPGLVACFSLLAQVSGILLAVSIPQQTLTLQGIAGIILSIGMGVDANVIIAERIKEEIRGGAPLPLALSQGFQRAFSSVLDGNVTVAIAAIVLMIFGSGTMLSFGYSLLVGVILNGITGVWLSRLMIGSLASWPRLQSPWLYGGLKRDEVTQHV